MISKKLLISYNNDYENIFENSYESIKEKLINRENRPKLFGKFIFIDERKLYDNKENAYWHSASMGEDDTKFDSDPCQNDDTKLHCKYRCNCDHEDNFLIEENRVPCLYRADRILWLYEIIRLVNINDLEKIKIWICVNNRKKEKNLKIRYVDNEFDIDYIIIFKIAYKKDKTDISSYKLITGYPVVLKSYKRRFDKEYNDYIKKKK